MNKIIFIFKNPKNGKIELVVKANNITDADKLFYKITGKDPLQQKVSVKWE